MKRTIQIFLMLAALGMVFQISAQNDWEYTGTIDFPEEDSLVVRPFLGTLDENGRLYVVSSKATTPNAHNAIYYADPGEDYFTKMIDYDLNGDSDTLLGNVGAIRGITTIGNDVLINASQPYPKTQPMTICISYYYTDADTLQKEVFEGSGWGSYNHGLEATSDSAVIMGISFQGPTHRWYNFSNSDMQGDRGRGTWLLPDPDDGNLWSNQLEPGGPENQGKDLIRDIALIPDGDYSSTETPFYSSRNSFSIDQITGGIAVWMGGTQEKPIDYTPSRVIDFNDFLSFIDPIPYGITVDKNGILWVAGIDSTRRWVKGFQLEGINAVAVYDLPSQFSKDEPDPDGAPMGGPCDVALTPDAAKAYVIDAYSKSVFVFENSTVSVDDNTIAEMDFTLEQNYPNPFNPSTLIKFTLPEQGNIKLVVTNSLGETVALLADEMRHAGTYAEVFNGEKLSSGIYFYSLITGKGKITKKMLLMK